MLATPCTSFSIARGRTCIIRTAAQPWGVSDRSQLSANDHRALKNGNRTCKAVLRVLNALVQNRVPFIMENPRASSLWQIVGVQRILANKDCFFITCDFCSFGAAWRKRTGLLCYGCDEVTANKKLAKTCTGCGGYCSTTLNKHHLLTDTAPCGRPWTLVAQPYPERLARALGSVLHHAAQSFS